MRIRKRSPFPWLAWIAAACLAAVRPAAAQEFEIVSANVANGEAGIALVDTFYFDFSRQLPFNSLFTRGFHWEPADLAHRTDAFLDADRTRPRFTIGHESETDYAVWVYGIQAQNGNYMARPFTLNYTTASSHGSLHVSGTLAPGERTASSKRSAMPEDTGGYRAVNQQQSFNRSIVFLLDEFSIDEGDWLVRAAETVNEGGEYEFQHVRPGTYYPLSIEFADPAGEEIAAYGIYDPDGDYIPNAVELNAQNADAINLDVYAFEGNTAFAFAALAEPLLAQKVAGVDLTSISSLNVSSDGSATQWEYEYYASEEDSVYTVDVNPIAISVDPAGASPFASAFQPIRTDDLIDSDEALAIAEEEGGEEFRAEADPEDLIIMLRGGSLFDEWPADPLRLLWRVRYEDGNPLDEAFRSHVVYVDMTTGEVVDVVGTSAEQHGELPAAVTLRQNYPNPFNPSTTIAFDLSAPRHVSLEVYDSIGRRVEMLLDSPLPAGPHQVVWNARNLPSGTYFYRLSAEGRSQSRSMVLLR